MIENKLMPELLRRVEFDYFSEENTNYKYKYVKLIYGNIFWCVNYKKDNLEMKRYNNVGFCLGAFFYKILKNLML